MEFPTGFGFRHDSLGASLPGMHQIIVQSPLSRIMAFLNISAEQVQNDPIARSKVDCYCRLQQDIDRGAEILELERQWSGPQSYHRG